jgi:predicted DNA-binding transcriptional regulator AlpA
MSIQNPLSPDLQFFDQLPNSANVRLPVVMALFACSPATIWRRVQSGHIPKPHRPSLRITCWNVGELRQALGVTQ